MTIRDEDNFMQGVWDWGILRGCFGETKIEPTDIDGCVERNGKFLILEAKKPDIEIPQGQRITLKRFANRGDTVIIVWGEKNKPIKLQVWYRGSERIIEPASIESFRKQVAAWFEWADKNGDTNNG